MEKILTATGLNKSFGSVCALSDVGLSINKGEIVALIGDNGAGKSTIVKLLSGVIRADSGSLQINGQPVDLKRYSVAEARSLGVETVHQERSLGEKQPLWRNVFVGRHLHNSFGFIDIKKEKEITLSMLKNSIGLKGVGVSAEAHVASLSGGERQALAISRAMYFDSVLTILDEPTTSLAVSEVDKVLRFIRTIPESGRSALFISHNLYHVHDVADRFIFVDRGRIVHECVRSEMSVKQLYRKLTKLSVQMPISVP